MLQVKIKSGDKLIKGFYDVLRGFVRLDFEHEGAVSSAFHDVLAGYGKKLHWTLVPQYSMKGRTGRIAIDGALLDEWKQRHGFWEAKDMHDDLEKEIKAKIEKGYPTNNMIFQAPERAILYQNGVRQGLNEDITSSKNLVELLKEFFAYREPDHEEWDAAVAEFKERIPELAARAKEIIDGERKSNREFREAFESFFSVCRKAINPNLSDEAVEKMLIQHLLTERIFRRVFHAEEFRSRNVIAAEIEKVIISMTSRHFSRDQFLSDLDRFYKAIERAADDKDDYSEKQAFLNTVYERFFQGYSPKEADTHGIVYTPQAIVDFMVRSVEDILKKEFGRSLADKYVHILDPFVGTGNFIVRVMRQIAETDKGALPYKYENELHCNEVMLLPYYIASMNIEHEYFAQTGEYRPFDGICLVDTFELAEPEQGGLEFMTEENTERVKQQKQAPIFVIIGNPPYNAWQEDERDENKNRKYPALDRRVAITYSKKSLARNKNALADPYVKAFRWAADRIGAEGLICFVSNNNFTHGKAFDGMRMDVAEEFGHILHIDLKGDARTSGEERKQQAGNVFDDAIKVRIGISALVKKTHSSGDTGVRVYSVPDYLSSDKKRDLLTEYGCFAAVPLQALESPGRRDWLVPAGNSEFSGFTKFIGEGCGIFTSYSNGVKTNRDLWAYALSREALEQRIRATIEDYNTAVAKWIAAGRDATALARIYDERVPWSETLKRRLQRCERIEFDATSLRPALYRPFDRRWLYFDSSLVERKYSNASFFPNAEASNAAIVFSEIGFRSPFAFLVVDLVPDVHLCGSDAFQSFPFYTYSEDGAHRRENITDWALDQFRSHYHDPSITKWDIFHYIYAVLHHPEYRSRYAANLKRELPRIPFIASVSSASSAAKVFRSLADAGKCLADLHVNYEKQQEYPLEKLWNPQAKLDYRVTKMRLSKDKSTLFYNDALTLKGIPKETYDYRLGNRSALEWVIDEYQVCSDRRSGITNDPNRRDDPQYILRLIGQVITVSLETVRIVKSFPEFMIGESINRATAS